MISFRNRIVLKRIHSWIEMNWIPLGLFAVLGIHGFSLGLSDDEAYYWVLAQKPSFSYAFHPPAVAWIIAIFQALFGWIFGNATPGLVRLPAALGAAMILYLSLNWLKEMGLRTAHRDRAAWVLLSFFGFFSLAWMMVPDIPLFLGWTLLFTHSWRACFGKLRNSHLILMSVGAALTLLSKYSGILAVFSAALSLALWAPQSKRNRAFFALALGSLAAATPILIWNSQHHWTSILYQIHDRHEGANLSLLRYLRFWLIELVLAGPLLIGFFFVFLSRIFTERCLPQDHSDSQTSRHLWAWLNRNRDGTLSQKKVRFTRYIAVWTLPAAAVFCIQPLVSDFKPHWAFIVWWPIVLALAWESQVRLSSWIQYQVSYGLALGSLILLSCHLPVGGLIFRTLTSAPFDPKVDATNDLYGWSELRSLMLAQLGPEIFNLPVVGSRYQTAAQAAFSLGEKTSVTLLPRDLREISEWPDLKISDGFGPQWPKLNTSVLFVSDNRYQSPPSFPGARCTKVVRLERTRFDLSAKSIDVWRCDP